MGLDAAHHPACFTALLVPDWVKPTWKLGWGIRLGVGWAHLGASHPHGSLCSLLACFPEQGFVCQGEGTHGTTSMCLTVCTFISLPPLPHPLFHPLHPHACVPVSPHTCYPFPRGMAHPLPSRPPPPWHRMARCLAHGGPRITPARWVPRSSKPASSAWVMILATTPRYLPPAWSTLRAGIRGEK